MSKKHVVAAIAAVTLVGAPVLGISIGTLAGAQGEPAAAAEKERVALSVATAEGEEDAAGDEPAPSQTEQAGESAPKSSTEESGSTSESGSTDNSESTGEGSREGDAGEGGASDPAKPADTTKPVIADTAFGPVRGVQTFTLSQEEADPGRTYVEIQQIVDGKWKKFRGEQFTAVNEFPFTVDTDILASGVRTQLKVSTWDASGNHTSKTFPVGIDRDRPTTTLVSPVPDSAQTALEIHVEAADAQGLDRVVANVYRGGTLIKSTQTGAAGATTAAHRASVELPDGEYVVRYNTRDLAGNVSRTENAAVVLDSTAPSIAVKPGVETVNGIYNAKPSFKLSDAGAGKVDYVAINGVKKDLTDAKWSDLNAQNYTAEQGENIVEVFDTAGNSSSFAFRYDSLAPEIRVKDGAVVVSGTFLNVPSFALVDQGAGQIDYVVVNGAKKDRTDNKWSDLNAQNYSPVEGENTIELFDTAGNSTVFTFMLDRTPPTITLKNAAQPVGGIYADEPSFKLHHPGLGQVDYVLINGVKKDLSNNRWSDLNGANYSAKQGDNVIEVVDTAGNSSSTTFVFDSVAPTVTVKNGLTPIDGVYTEKPSLKLYDAGPGKVDYVLVNGTKKDLSNAKYSDLNAGNYSAKQGENTIEVFDTVGNSSVFTFQLG